MFSVTRAVGVFGVAHVSCVSRVEAFITDYLRDYVSSIEKYKEVQNFFMCREIGIKRIAIFPR